MPEKRKRAMIDTLCVSCGVQFRTRYRTEKQGIAKTCSIPCREKMIADNFVFERKPNQGPPLSMEEIMNLPENACGMRLNNGSICILDPDDYDKIAHMSFGVSRGYVTKYLEWVTGKRRPYMLTRLLFDVPEDMVVDHINGNKLDNRRSNLRICTQAKNAVNKSVHSNNKLGLKGVSLDKKTGKFAAEVRMDGKRYRLGIFNDPLEAKTAYNKAALALHGEFARLN